MNEKQVLESLAGRLGEWLEELRAVSNTEDLKLVYLHISGQHEFLEHVAKYTEVK